MDSDNPQLAGIFFEARDLDRGEILLLDGPAGLLHHAALPPPAMLVVVDGEKPAFTPIESGGLRVTRALFWSLLWPSRAGEMAFLAAEDTGGQEAALKKEAKQFRRRLAWWAQIDPSIRDHCAGLMKRHAPASEGVVQVLNRLSYSSPPVEAEQIPEETDGELPEPPAAPGEISKWFAAEESFGRLFGAEFTPRFEQGRLAAEVAEALDNGQALLAEAGTGVGKTLAYLLPLLMRRRLSDGRAVISTHTRALQKQILEQDFPILGRVFPEFRARLLMGRRNYLCRRAHQEFLSASITSASQAWEKVALQLWLAETEDGLREELTGHPLLGKRLGELFDHGQPCSHRICFGTGGCYVQRARKRAREADIVVVNHALLMNDLLAEEMLIGAREVLLVDEAHRLPAVALDTHSIVCDRGRAKRIGELLGEKKAGGTIPVRLAELARQLAGSSRQEAEAVESIMLLAGDIMALMRQYDLWWEALREHYAGSVPGPAKLRIRDKDEAFGPLRPVTASLLQAASKTNAAFAKVAGRTEVLDDLSDGAEENLASLASAGQRLAQLEKDVRFVTSDPDEDWVTWLSMDGRGKLRSAGATLLESGPLLKGYWQNVGPAPVMTSATLTVAGDFSHMLNELGLTGRRPRTGTVLLDSPFDYESQARFLVPTNLPPPTDSAYETSLVEVLAPLLPWVPNKAMILFTSYASLERVADSLQAFADDDQLFSGTKRPMPEILRQRPGGGALQLLTRFRRSERAVLFGTATFWEGVDFAGRDLELLVVTRLPFLVPNDPWVEAKGERIKARGENPFTEFMVRDAVLRLRQGVGRLIRRSTDQGIVLLLDSRLHSKSYGVTFLNSLPAASRFCRWSDSLTTEMAEFLNRPYGG